MPRQHPSSATTPCSKCCQSASCIFRARESRTTSPTKRSGLASPSGNSAANSRHFLRHHLGGVALPQLRLVSLPYPNLRRGGGGRRDHYTFVHGATTMLALGLLLNVAGIGLFCWLIFTLAVYALPLFVAINAGIWAYHSGAGLLGTPLFA